VFAAGSTCVRFAAGYRTVQCPRAFRGGIRYSTIPACVSRQALTADMDPLEKPLVELGKNGVVKRASLYTWSNDKKTVLGSGSYGIVRLAYVKASGTAVAMKQQQLAIDDDDVARELEILKVCVHPNVVEVLDAFETGFNQSAIVMPVADQSLKDYVDRRRAGCDASFVMALAQQLSDGLAHVHDRGVLHRDLKPANILLTWSMGSVRAVIADFGMSRRFSTESRKALKKKTTVTMHNVPLSGVANMSARVATLWYRPPQLFITDGSDAPGSTRCSYGFDIDVWSFGATMHEVIVGWPLVRAADALEAMQMLWQALGPCPQQLWPPIMNEKLAQRFDSTDAASMRRQPLSSKADRAGWNLVTATLQWDPADRPTMAHVRKMVAAGSEAALNDSNGLGSGVSRSQQVSGNASTLQITATSSEKLLAAAHLRSPADPDGAFLDYKGRPTAIGAMLAKCPPCAPTFVVSDTCCSCSGNCNQPGHQRNGCDSKQLVDGARYCHNCVCEVPGCGSPRHRSPLCKAHGTVLATLPPAFALVRAYRDHLHLMVPVDITHFMRHVKQNVAFAPLHMQLIIALLKQPTAVDLLEVHASKGDVMDGAFVADALRNMIRGMQTLTRDATADSVAEMSQLHRQGVARFTGVATTCCNLDVIRKDANGDIRLGLGNHRYSFVDGHDTLAKLVDGCRRLPTAPSCVGDGYIQAYCTWARAVFTTLASEGCLPKGIGPLTSYVSRFIIRKLVLAHMNTLGADPVNWEEVSMAEIVACTADATGMLDEIPPSWTACDLSRFLFGRSDWGIFASMFGCLWKEVADNHETDTITELIPPSALASNIHSFVNFHRVTPSPAALVEWLQLRVGKGDASLSVTTRAASEASSKKRAKRSASTGDTATNSSKKSKG
jgi:serine/threonine protein kinase